MPVRPYDATTVALQNPAGFTSELLAGAIAHLNTLLHTGCSRAGALAVVCLTRYAEEADAAHAHHTLACACRDLAETLTDQAH